MASACSKDMSITPRDHWIYEERQNELGWFVVLPALAMALAAFMMTVMAVRSCAIISAVIVMAAGVTIYALRALARNAVMIDRRSGIVRITTVGAPWRRRKIRELGEFDRVAVWERRTPVDAGYYASLYSIVLLGAKGPLQLLTTDDEREASAVRDEVTSFLRFK